MARFKRECSFMANGQLVHWLGYFLLHVKWNSDVEEQLKKAYRVKVKITILCDWNTNRLKCCCFAWFATHHNLTHFLTYRTNKIILFGKLMKVDKLKPQGGMPEEDM
jgi:hypothetical protein